MKNWEAVIGLEIHVQLNTKSKLFSGAPNTFGAEPNTNISVVCTGQPGALPVINKEAVKKAVQFGLAINSKIAKLSTFDRKSYFYPDSPRNFQITQYENPIVIGGTVIADVNGETREFKVHHAHLEDDAGMLKHFTTFAGVDFNRSGVPLLEIVSEPQFHTSKEAISYAMAIKAIMEYIDASDCNMDEGSLRIDANVSVRPIGEKTLRNKTEIKNMNSFTMLEVAMDSEIKRQIDCYLSNPNEDITKIISSATYRWDPTKKETVMMRKKESADDYRYFPEPDLVPIILTEDYIETIRKELPELPHDRFKRYVTTLTLSEYSASILINDKKLADFFEDGLKTCSNAKALCNWITIEFAGKLKETGDTIFSKKIKSSQIAKLVNLIDNGTINGKIAKSVADEMILFPEKDCETIIKENPNFIPLSDETLIKTFVDTVIKENPQSVIDYKNGKTKAFGFLVGQVMKLSQGKATPQVVNEILKKKLES